LSYEVKAVPVSHSIDAAAFVVSARTGSLVYSGDTGPTERLWEVISELPRLKALVIEVSFPNHEQKLATLSGHHTPFTLARDLKKLAHPAEVATLLFHMKPVFQREIERECARLRGFNLEVAQLDQKLSF
jgi:ribonuclease BN (tRNA processing enzyme)